MNEKIIEILTAALRAYANRDNWSWDKTEVRALHFRVFDPSRNGWDFADEALARLAVLRGEKPPEAQEKAIPEDFCACPQCGRSN